MDVEKLNFQDSAFLRLDSPRRPYHVAGLMLFRKPAGAPPSYMRTLARHCGRLNEIWPIFNKQLSNPDDVRGAGWVTCGDYEPRRHVFHYALPAPGSLQQLLDLVSAAHERPLDRCRPLWEIHLIEGLGPDRYALYCKVHHALVDGVGALRMIDALFSTSPDARIDFRRARPLAEAEHRRQDLLREMQDMTRELRKQYAAVPQLSGLLAQMGLNTLRGKRETMQLPFTAPRTLFNQELDSSRRAVICDLSLAAVRRISRRMDCSINDVLLAVCGGALRQYLSGLGKLPRKSLLAGLPVSLKQGQADEGNRLSFILCPFFTDEPDPLRRLQRVARTTRKAKSELAKLSSTASQDLANMMLMPTIILTLSGNATRFNPVINAIFSNVPGSRDTLYLDGSELESLYPLSVVTDGMAVNLTVVSYVNKLCFAITACPTGLPGVERLAILLKQSYRDLNRAVQHQGESK